MHQSAGPPRARSPGQYDESNLHSCAEAIIWLGKEGPETHSVVEILQILANIPNDLWSDMFSYSSPRAPHITADECSAISNNLACHDLPYAGENVCDVLFSFFRRSWFHRIWTVQECVLPSEGHIWYGGYRILAMGGLARIGRLAEFYLGVMEAESTVAQASSIWDVLYYLRQFLFSNIAPKESRVQTAFLSQSRPFDTSACVVYGRIKKCSGPRDHVYGMLGLQRQPLVKVDYGISVQQLYEQVTLHPTMLKTLFNDLEDNSVRSISGLPSWVNDWSTPSVPSPWTSCGGRRIYRTGIIEGRDISCNQICSGLLEVEGFEEDEISLLGGGDFQQTFTREGLLASLNALHVASRKPHQLEELRNKCTMIERFWRTLIADLPGNSNCYPSSEYTAIHFELSYSFDFRIISHASIATTANGTPFA